MNTQQNEVQGEGFLPVPAPHHRPPAVEYRNGVPYHYTVGQAPAPQYVVVQAPADQGMSPAQREMVINVMLILAVIVVCVASVCAVAVVMGGTLMGIIGVVSASAVPLAMTVVATIVAVGWAAGRVRGLSSGSRKGGRR